MKRIITIIAALGLAASAYAQDAQSATAAAAEALLGAPTQEKPVEKPNYWKTSLVGQLNFSQSALTNWAAGGDNTYALAGYIDGNANYKKGEMFWNNRLQLDYGFLYASSKPIIQKNNDRIYLESKWGYVTPIRHINLTANFDFKSQFSNGYNYNTPNQAIIDEVSGTPGVDLETLPLGTQTKAWEQARSIKSGFLAPAYTNLALGIDWTPYKWLSINAAPATAGFVIVKDPLLRSSYSMEIEDKFKSMAETDPAYIAAKESGELYKSSRFELGAQVKIDAKVKVNDNINYSTQLVLFSNYLKNPQNVRVNWDNRLNWQLSKIIALSVVTNLIYDDNVLIKTTEYIKKNPTGAGYKAIQFKEALSIGLTYTFGKK